MPKSKEDEVNPNWVTVPDGEVVGVWAKRDEKTGEYRQGVYIVDRSCELGIKEVEK